MIGFTVSFSRFLRVSNPHLTMCSGFTKSFRNCFDYHVHKMMMSQQVAGKTSNNTIDDCGRALKQ